MVGYIDKGQPFETIYGQIAKYLLNNMSDFKIEKTDGRQSVNIFGNGYNSMVEKDLGYLR